MTTNARQREEARKARREHEHFRREQDHASNIPEREKTAMGHGGEESGHAHKAGKKGVERHREHEVHE
jgi:hypothetical protein